MSEEGNHRYFNKNNGHVVSYPRPSARLESYQNWVKVEDDDHLSDLQAEHSGTRSARGNLLGSSNVGDRKEARHQVPPETRQPKVEFTEPSKTQLPGQHPDPEAFHQEKQPEVITVDPSQQVQPKTGPDKRDLSAQPPTDEQLDMNPNAAPIGAGSDEGVLARAHPELEGVEDRRQKLISEQQQGSDQGDPEAGHDQPTPSPDPDVVSTDGTGPNPANRPARSATKEAWIDWAVECGADRADAKTMTKTDLIEVYGE